MRARLLLLSVVSLLALAALASSAGATQYCVGDFTLCLANPTDSYPGTQAGLEEAIAAAQTNLEPDTIKLGAVTIDISSPVVINAPTGEGLSLVGAGKGKSVLHFTQTEDEGLAFDTGGATNSEISGLTVQLDGAFSTGKRWGVSMEGGTISDVNFVVDSESDNDYPATGALLSGGATCEYCSFSISHDEASGAETTGAATIVSSEFDDASGADDETTGVVVNGGGETATIKQSHFVEVNIGVSVTNGTANLFDSLIDLGGHQFAAGVDVENTGDSHNTLDAQVNGVSIVGGATGQRAVYVEAGTSDALGERASATVANSLIFFTGGSLPSAVRCVTDTNGTGEITQIYTFAQSTVPSVSGCTATNAANVSSAGTNPGDLFVNWDEGDLRLKPGAPVIDLGDPGVDNFGGRLDARGATRVVAGPTSGTAVIDMGGIEYQDYPPEKPAVGASAKTIEEGGSVDFTSSSFDGNGDALSYSWDFKDGSTSTEQNPTHTFTKPGSYLVQVRAAAGGLQSEVGEIEITVTARAKSDCCSAGAGYTNNFVYNKPSGPFKFTKSSKLKNGFALSAKKPKGASIKIDVTGGPVEVVLTLATKKGKKLKGTQRITFPLGRSYMTFGGKWNKKKLTTGGYTLSSQRLIDIGTNTLPSRLSMNVTTPKQTR